MLDRDLALLEPLDPSGFGLALCISIGLNTLRLSAPSDVTGSGPMSLGFRRPPPGGDAFEIGPPLHSTR